MARTTRSLIAAIIGAAFVLLLTKLFFLDMIVVRGDSMSPSLKEGTPIFINKLAVGLARPTGGASLLHWGTPARGDIVVFLNPLDNTPTVKRCLAVAGDTLRVSDHELVFGGRRQPLKFYQEGLIGREMTVAPGCLFLVGDNAAVSADSRTFGPVPLEQVTGVMVFPPPWPGPEGSP
jgi:signal peptidase I